MSLSTQAAINAAAGTSGLSLQGAANALVARIEGLSGGVVFVGPGEEVPPGTPADTLVVERGTA